MPRKDGAPGHFTLISLRDEQSFRILPGDREQFQRGLSRAAGALLPTPHGVRAHVQVCGEKRLTGLERLTDAASLPGRDFLWPRRNARDPQIHGLAAFVSGYIPK